MYAPLGVQAEGKIEEAKEEKKKDDSEFGGGCCVSPSLSKVPIFLSVCLSACKPKLTHIRPQ